MKFIVSSAELLKRLSNINGVITTNPVVPILENFLFDKRWPFNHYSLRSSDLHDYRDRCGSKGGWEHCCTCKNLMDTLKNLPEQPVTFQLMLRPIV